jgi:hypothetical protein
MITPEEAKAIRAKIERLTAALIAVAASRRLSAAHHIARAALEPKP